MACRARVLRGVAVDHDGARHHVLGDARPDRAPDIDPRLLVHARAVVPGGAPDGNLDGRVETDGNRVTAPRVLDVPCGAVDRPGLRLKRGVQITQRRDCHINDLHLTRPFPSEWTYPRGSR